MKPSEIARRRVEYLSKFEEALSDIETMKAIEFREDLLLARAYLRLREDVADIRQAVDQEDDRLCEWLDGALEETPDSKKPEMTS